MKQGQTYFGFRILPNVWMYRPAGCGALVLLLLYVPAPIWIGLCWWFAAAHPHDPVGAATRLLAKGIAITAACLVWAFVMSYLIHRPTARRRG